MTRQHFAATAIKCYRCQQQDFLVGGQKKKLSTIKTGRRTYIAVEYNHKHKDNAVEYHCPLCGSILFATLLPHPNDYGISPEDAEDYCKFPTCLFCYEDGYKIIRPIRTQQVYIQEILYQKEHIF